MMVRLKWTQRPIQIEIKMSETDAAYIAGIVDGEGHIGINLYWKGEVPVRANPIIVISCGHKPTVDWIHKTICHATQWREEYGIYARTEGRYVKEAVSHFNVGVCGIGRVRALLHTLLPHLKIKQGVARAMLLFLKHHKKWIYTRNDWIRVAKVIRQNNVRRDSSRAREKKLNDWIKSQ